MASSPNEAVTLLTGSGEVLMSARVPALTTWLLAAKVPPRRVAVVWMVPPLSPKKAAASAAPAGMRI
jgi:hypothetical protein